MAAMLFTVEVIIAFSAFISNGVISTSLVKTRTGGLFTCIPIVVLGTVKFSKRTDIGSDGSRQTCDSYCLVEAPLTKWARNYVTELYLDQEICNITFGAVLDTKIIRNAVKITSLYGDI